MERGKGAGRVCVALELLRVGVLVDVYGTMAMNDDVDDDCKFDRVYYTGCIGRFVYIRYGIYYVYIVNDPPTTRRAISSSKLLVG